MALSSGQSGAEGHRHMMCIVVDFYKRGSGKLVHGGEIDMLHTFVRNICIENLDLTAISNHTGAFKWLQLKAQLMPLETAVL
jgi:hypothetical protein